MGQGLKAATTEHSIVTETDRPTTHLYLHRLWRAVLQDSSLLDREEVLEALPFPRSEAGVWLDENVPPLAGPAGCRVYRWGAVVQALQSGAGRHALHSATETLQPPTPHDWLTTAEAAARLGMARSSLDEMVEQAPRDLPGAPTPVGTGQKRTHWRWIGSSLDLWLAAYREWVAQRELDVAPVPASGVAATGVARRIRHKAEAQRPAPSASRKRKSLLAEVKGNRARVK